MKSHCDYECNCSSEAQGPCSSDGARCFMRGNTEERKVRIRRKEGEWEAKAGGQDGPFFFSSSLLPSSPLPPTFSSSSSLILPPFSSLGRISRVSLEGKCNNAPTRWNRARSIISREMDGPCRAGGGQARTQFRFNKLAKQDPQSDLSLTRRQCLLLRC